MLQVQQPRDTANFAEDGGNVRDLMNQVNELRYTSKINAPLKAKNSGKSEPTKEEAL